MIGVQQHVSFDSPRAGEIRVSLGDPSRAARETGTRNSGFFHRQIAHCELVAEMVAQSACSWRDWA